MTSVREIFVEIGSDISPLSRTGHFPLIDYEYITFSNDPYSSWSIYFGRVDIVYMANVLGDPNNLNSAELLKSTRQLLRPSGQLIVVELYSPYRRNKLEMELPNFGFTITKIVKANTNEWKAEREKFFCNPRGERDQSDSYVLYASPV